MSHRRYCPQGNRDASDSAADRWQTAAIRAVRPGRIHGLGWKFQRRPEIFRGAPKASSFLRLTGKRLRRITDHPIIHETMRAIVRSVRADAQFHGQFDLEAGLSQATRLSRLGLVLVDLGLPGCTGMEALTRCQRRVRELARRRQLSHR